ncbi:MULTISPECIES: hypothetical protein [Hungatella]|jgi:hypothetical protein|uniref:hypothetical protein n=1 Tax=Hungatella TaxID=1649459 RepID=UPI0003AACB6A|nr:MULTISPECIES: hypothetical protein [Hungatella]
MKQLNAAVQTGHGRIHGPFGRWSTSENALVPVFAAEFPGVLIEEKEKKWL